MKSDLLKDDRLSEYYPLNFIDIQMKPKVNKRNNTSNYTFRSTTNVTFSSWGTSFYFSRNCTRFRTWSNELQWPILLMQVLTCCEQNLLPVGPAIICCYHRMDAKRFGTKILVPPRFYIPSWQAKKFSFWSPPQRRTWNFLTTGSNNKPMKREFFFLFSQKFEQINDF